MIDPIFWWLEYIIDLSDSLFDSLSIKRLEVFIFKKEYNPNKFVKKTNPKDEKTIIDIDIMDFDIITKKEEFNNQYEEEFSKKDDKLSSSSGSEEKDDTRLIINLIDIIVQGIYSTPFFAQEEEYVIFNSKCLIKVFYFKINETNSDNIINPTKRINTEYEETVNIEQTIEVFADHLSQKNEDTNRSNDGQKNIKVFPNNNLKTIF